MAEENRQPFLLFLLVAVIGVAAPLISLSPATSPAPRPALAQAPAAEPPRDRAPAPEDECDAAWRRPLEEIPRASEYSLRTLIATVPDPLDSVVDYRFDRALDALRRAAMAAGYQPDRFWLPWTDDRRARAREEALKQSGRPSGCRQRTPGRMIFRDDRGRRLIQILLVGETASWGLHPRAFARALAEAAARSASSDDPILIAGPAFSGTAPSLRDGIERFTCASGASRVFHIVNGGATSPKLAEILPVQKRQLACPGASEGVSISVTYSATVADDRKMLSWFSRYLLETTSLERTHRDRVRSTLDCIVKDMAILTETGTAYGAEAMGHGDVACEGGRSSGWYGGVCQLPADKRDLPCSGYMPSLVVQYPPHIARLRTEYERQRQRLEGKPRDEPPGDGARSLELSLDPARPDDPTEIVPNLSGKTPYSEDLVLTHAIAAMCRQEMRWVGILGTDTVDQLFLAHELKRLCPNVRLFFLESDVFYTHPEYGRDLDGSVVISPYPLLPQNRAWSAPFDTNEIAQFAAQSDEGLYNAVLALIDTPDHPTARAERELSPPFCDDAGRDPDDHPVWVTAIGNGGLWPIAVLGEDKIPAVMPDGQRATCAIHAGGDARWRFDSQGQWRFLIIALSLVGALVAGGYWTARFSPETKRLPGGLGWAEPFPGPRRGSPSIERAFFALVALAPAALGYLLIAGTAFIEAAVNRVGLNDNLSKTLLTNLREVAAEAPLRRVPVLIIAAALVISVIDVIAVEVMTRLDAIRKTPWSLRGIQARILIVDTAVLAAAAFGLSRRHGINPFKSGAGPVTDITQAILFRERTGNLSSGVSPLAPALALGAALFLAGMLNLRRLSRAPSGPAARLFAGDDHFEIAGGTRVAALLQQSLLSLAGNLPALAVAVVVSLVVWLPFQGRIGSLEGPVWDRAIWWISLFVITASSAALAGFVIGWRQLRALLQRYACLPLVGAWSRLPPRYATRLGGLLLARPPDITELGVAVRQLHRLVAALPDTETDGAAAGAPIERLARLRRDLTDAMAVDAEFAAELRESAGRRGDATVGPTFARLCTAAGMVAEALAEAWRGAMAEGDPRAPEGGAAAWQPIAEDLIATLSAGQVFHALGRLRHRLTLAIGALLLLLTAVISYPFERQKALLWLVEAGVVAFVGVAMILIVEMEKNEVLSRIQHTEPGTVSFNRTFLVKIAIFALLPLFSVVAAGVPAIGQVLFGWVVPLLKLMQ